MGLIKNVHLIYLDGCIFKPVSVLLTYISRAFLPLPWLRQPWQSHKAHCTVIGDGLKISVKLFFDTKYSFAHKTEKTFSSMLPEYLDAFLSL